MNCKDCIHEPVCKLWRDQDAQDASIFYTDGCGMFLNKKTSAKYLVVYTYEKDGIVGTGASPGCQFAHCPPTAEDVVEMQNLFKESFGFGKVVITNWLTLSESEAKD